MQKEIMYIQKTFKTAYSLLRKYWKNMLVYAVPFILLHIIYFIFATIAYFGLYGGMFFVDIFHQIIAEGTWAPLFILTLLLGIIAFLVLFIAASNFAKVMMNRVGYLTLKEIDIPLNMGSVVSLFKYAEENFLQFFKLNIVISASIIIGILIFVFLGYILIFYVPWPSNLILAVPLFILLLIAYLVFAAVTSTAVILFFMGNEKKGVLALLKMGWGIFIHNVVEYILLHLAFFVIVFVYGVVMTVFFMVCTGPLEYILQLIFMFYIDMVFFVFVNFLKSKKR